MTKRPSNVTLSGFKAMNNTQLSREKASLKKDEKYSSPENVDKYWKIFYEDKKRIYELENKRYLSQYKEKLSILKSSNSAEEKIFFNEFEKSGLPVSPPIEMLTEPTNWSEEVKDIHYNLRSELSKRGFKVFEEDLKKGELSKNWKILPESESIFHNLDKNGKEIKPYPNLKFVDKATGALEVVVEKKELQKLLPQGVDINKLNNDEIMDKLKDIDINKLKDIDIQNKLIVKEPQNIGTFNFASHNAEGGTSAHVKYDVKPYIDLGNSDKDNTDVKNRIDLSLKGTGLKVRDKPQSVAKSIKESLETAKCKFENIVTHDDLNCSAIKNN